MAFVSCTKLDTELATKQDALVDCDGNPIPAGTAVALCSDLGSGGGLTTVSVSSPIIGDGTPGNPIRLDPVALCAYIQANCSLTPCALVPLQDCTGTIFGYGFGPTEATAATTAGATVILTDCASATLAYVYPASGVGHTVQLTDCTGATIGYASDAGC